MHSGKSDPSQNSALPEQLIQREITKLHLVVHAQQQTFVVVVIAKPDHWTTDIERLQIIAFQIEYQHREAVNPSFS